MVEIVSDARASAHADFSMIQNRAEVDPGYCDAMYFGPTDHTLRIALRDVQPEIWRRVVVPSEMPLPIVARVFEIAMGWKGHHLHQFEVAGILFGSNEDAEYMIDHRDVTFGQIARSEGTTLRWDYDFGDGWEHDVLVEGIGEPKKNPKSPNCVGGEHAGPPEDCGGPYGYQHFLEAFGEPTHEDHLQMKAWTGGDFDPSLFDRKSVNAQLRSMRLPPRRAWG